MTDYKLINIYEISRRLGKHPRSIDRKRIPKKLKPHLDEIISFIENKIKEIKLNN